jgi:hypothetical protein
VLYPPLSGRARGKTHAPCKEEGKQGGVRGIDRFTHVNVFQLAFYYF